MLGFLAFMFCVFGLFGFAYGYADARWGRR